MKWHSWQNDKPTKPGLYLWCTCEGPDNIHTGVFEVFENKIRLYDRRYEVSRTIIKDVIDRQVFYIRYHSTILFPESFDFWTEFTIPKE